MIKGNYTYDILHEIGKGGMGAVFKVHIRELDCCAALKRVEKSGGKKTIRNLSFEKEIQILKILNYSGIPAYIDSFEDTQAQYLAMEYIDGCTLSDVFQKKQISSWRIRNWMKQSLRILRYLHEQKPCAILYLDLKPQNLMISKGHIYLIDFGSACYENEGEFAWTATPRICS